MRKISFFIKCIYCSLGAFALVAGVVGCMGTGSSDSSNALKTENRPKEKIFVKDNNDTLKDGSAKVTSKKSWELTYMLLKKDTLELVSENKFFYYPFGKYKSIEDFVRDNKTWGQYKQEVVDTSNSIILFKFSDKNSYLNVFKSTDTKLIEIVQAKISDDKIFMTNGIKIGMSQKDFLKIFFVRIDDKRIDNIKIVKFISALSGVWNNYYFIDNKLNYYTFDTDYTFKRN